MIEIRIETVVQAPMERVFDLSRSIDFHSQSVSHTREQAIAGRTSGLIELGETVTWKAKHFGIWQTLTTQITAFDHPRHFRDEMVSGAFTWMHHDHFFEPTPDGRVLMTDIMSFKAPFGIIGWLTEHFLLKSYFRRFLTLRNLQIKAACESDLWRKYLVDPHHHD